MSIETMVRELFSLASPLRTDRAALAALRRSVGTDNQRILAAKYVLPHIPDTVRREVSRGTYDAYFTVAGLFSIWANAPQTVTHLLSRDSETVNRVAWSRKSVGSMMRALVNQNEDAMERRFTRLLSAREERFREFLRQAFQLTRNAKLFVPIDFVNLFHDIRLWDSPSGESVREQWAQDFYPPQSNKNENEEGDLL